MHLSTTADSKVDVALLILALIGHVRHSETTKHADERHTSCFVCGISPVVDSVSFVAGVFSNKVSV